MKPPGHQMILASAGSGKTYALTNRFIRLLVLGAPPERIVALTFTRKAAGEFFDEILTKLAHAAGDPAAAAKLAEKIEAPDLAPPDFRRHLRAMVEAMPRLSLGTFDSFFARIVRAFPLELGLAGDFEILEEHGAHLERRRVLRRLFAGAAPDPAQREFIEAFKRATFGLEEKRLAARLDEFLDEHQNLHLGAPDAELWGNAARIWPAGSPWLVAAEARGEAASLRRLLAARTDLADNQRARWDAFFAALELWSPGAKLTRPVEYILENSFDVWPALLAGAASVTIERKRLALAPDECRALAALVRAIVGAELARRLEITRGIHAVLAAYERVYHQAVRRAGRLTFADVQRLLAPDGGAPLLASEGDEGDALERRLYLDWRLDARFDHWLLDEFQDTSRGQWRVLRNLIDEAVQDSSGRRTFFYVGDVKQAIYGWREGDARLFREIYDLYNSGPEKMIKEERLDSSWRSGPAVLEMVNRVFGDAAALARLSPEAGARWSREWRAHRSEKPGLGGHAAWLHAGDEQERFAVVLQLLATIRPLERGLTVAVLVQKNDTAARLADFLRREGRLPAVAEADLHVCTDNPLGAALLALCQAAAHPGDTLAQEHVRMTPLRAVLERADLATPERLSERLLGQIHGDGFESTLAWWLDQLAPRLAPDDAFSRARGEQILEAARLFDEAGGRDVAEFIQFMQRHTVRDADTPAIVRVMTIHKAKGLGFDLVVAADLDGQRLATRRDGLAVRKSAGRAVEWILDLPPTLLREFDDVLAAQVRDEEADACYEKLALLYVAMTRAKRGLYLVTKPPGTSESLNFVRLLADALGAAAEDVAIGDVPLRGGFATGDPRWFESLAPAPAPAAGPPAPPRVPEDAARSVRHPARTPSAEKTGLVSGAALFAAARESAAAFGTAVHEALAAVAWWDAALAGAWARTLREAGVPDDAIEEARACLEAPALSDVFVRPPGAAVEVWRERAFEIVLDGAWVTGVFDRVVLERDAGGRARFVSVFDFKTDRVGPQAEDRAQAAARYAGQLELYRRAASRLAGVPPDRVACAIVFTGALDAAGARAAPVVIERAGTA